MSESVQAVVALLMIIGGIGAFFSILLGEPPDWRVFGGMTTLCLSSLGLLVWSMRRRDKVPDFLATKPGAMFERDGFCFKTFLRVEKGGCWFDLFFQSRHEGRSEAVVVVQPSKGFFLNRPDIASLVVDVQCPGGGFGWVSVPWAVARKYQGKTQSFDVAADVRYPDWRGNMIRFNKGLRVGSAGNKAWRTALTVAGAMGGMFVLHKSATLKIRLPVDVQETVDEELPILRKIEWQLGDDAKRPAQAKKAASDPDF